MLKQKTNILKFFGYLLINNGYPLILMKLTKYCLLLLFLFVAFSAFSIIRPEEFTIEEYNRMDFIFIGTAISVSETPYYIDMPDPYIKITFTIDKVFKGDSSKRLVSIFTPFLSTLGHLDLKANQKWLIYSSKIDSKFVVTKNSSSILYDSIEKKDLDLLTEINNYRNCFYIGKYTNGKIAGKGRFENGKPVGLWKYYNNKGFLSYGGYYKNGVKDSTWLFYWDLKRQFTKTVNTFNNGTLDGKQLEYFITDTLGKVFYCKAGKLDGNFYEFYQSGKLKINGFYKDNLKTGVWTVFNEKSMILTKDTIPWTGHYKGRDSLGIVIEEGDYENGLQKGEWVLSDGEGNVIEKINYKNGVVDGKRTERYVNGQKLAESNYIMGAKDGIFINWYPNGKIKSEIKYRLDTIQYSKLWNESGIKLLEETFENGLYQTKVEWDDNGIILSEEEYKDGDPSGIWNQYFNGKLNWKREIINNETGNETWYYENGNKKEEGIFNFNNGKRIGKWKIWNEKGKLIGTKEYS